MSYRFFAQGGVTVIRWGTPQMADVQDLITRVSALHDAYGPVVYVSIVPAAAPPPPKDVMATMIRRYSELSVLCDSLSQVFEGEGLGVSLKRSVLTGMIIAVNRCVASDQRLRIKIHATLEGMVRHIAPARQAEVEAAVQAYRRSYAVSAHAGVVEVRC